MRWVAAWSVIARVPRHFPGKKAATQLLDQDESWHAAAVSLSIPLYPKATHPGPALVWPAHVDPGPEEFSQWRYRANPDTPGCGHISSLRRSKSSWSVSSYWALVASAS